MRKEHWTTFTERMMMATIIMLVLICRELTIIRDNTLTSIFIIILLILWFIYFIESIIPLKHRRKKLK